VNTGATNATLKLSDVKVTSIDSNTGAGRLDITVGQPMGFVQIKVNGKTKYIGTFGDEKEAAMVYDDAATKFHGEFARLNFEEKDSNHDHQGPTRLGGTGAGA